MESEQREKLERLARYMTRSAVAVDRLSFTPQGQVRYRLKTPYRDGTTHMVLEALDFLARLAAPSCPPPPLRFPTCAGGLGRRERCRLRAMTPSGDFSAEEPAKALR